MVKITNIREYIKKLVERVKNLVDREIIYLLLMQEQMGQFFKNKPALLVWEKEK